MIKKLGLTTATLSILLLSGCGGGGNDTTTPTITEQMKTKDGIVIYHETNSAFCEVMKAYFANPSVKNVKNILTYSTNNSIGCDAYGRTATSNLNIAGNCYEITLADLVDYDSSLQLEDISIYEDPSHACVIGADKK
ncbi:MAG: hypothetical protein DSZ12_02450 [Sulfurovum sp.]|nr:MAG: hypothetical protein DSZ08_04815 [Sulfurovum sp.]RUM76148.1 MAG: hypothetical protein DSZ12_02450 [Sulfurovum sp.]